MGEDDGVFFLFKPVDFEGERGDGATSLVVPFFPARVTLDVHERAEQAGGLGVDLGG